MNKPKGSHIKFSSFFPVSSSGFENRHGKCNLGSYKHFLFFFSFLAKACPGFPLGELQRALPQVLRPIFGETRGGGVQDALAFCAHTSARTASSANKKACYGAKVRLWMRSFCSLFGVQRPVRSFCDLPFSSSGFRKVCGQISVARVSRLPMMSGHFPPLCVRWRHSKEP